MATRVARAAASVLTHAAHGRFKFMTSPKVVSSIGCLLADKQQTSQAARQKPAAMHGPTYLMVCGAKWNSTHVWKSVTGKVRARKCHQSVVHLWRTMSVHWAHRNCLSNHWHGFCSYNSSIESDGLGLSVYSVFVAVFRETSACTSSVHSLGYQVSLTIRSYSVI